MSSPVVRIIGLTRSFQQGDVRIDVLRGVDLSINPGEIVALLGASGSGKSTMLQAVGLLEGGFGGRIEIAGHDASRLDGDARAEIRRDHLGFVYQFHHLLPDFDATENVVLPQLVAGRSQQAAEERACELLTALGLGERLHHRPSKLSGGEQQRVAVARALANQPSLILADEPTAALDSRRGRQVMELFAKVAHEQQAAVVVVTHDARALDIFDRIVEMEDGRLKNEPKQPQQAS